MKSTLESLRRLVFSGWSSGLFAIFIASCLRVVGWLVPMDWLHYAPGILLAGLAGAVVPALLNRMTPAGRLISACVAVGLSVSILSHHGAQGAPGLLSIRDTTICVSSLVVSAWCISTVYVRPIDQHWRLCLHIALFSGFLCILVLAGYPVIDPFDASRLLRPLPLASRLRIIWNGNGYLVWSHLALVPVALSAIHQPAIYEPGWLARQRGYVGEGLRWLACFLGAVAGSVCMVVLFVGVWSESGRGPYTLDRAVRHDPMSRPLRGFLDALSLGDLEAISAFCEARLTKSLREPAASVHPNPRSTIEKLVGKDLGYVEIDKHWPCKARHCPQEWDIFIGRGRLSSEAFTVSFVRNPDGQPRGWYLDKFVEMKERHDWVKCRDSQGLQ